MRIFILLTCLITIPAFAQKEEETAVRAVVDRLFEGMAKHDSTIVRSVFHPTARLQSATMNKEKQPVLQSESIDKFVKSIGSIPANVSIEERLTGYEIRVDDRLATAWTSYEFYLNGKLSHTGVDAFQLYKTDQGWKIIQISDTRKW
ncbi:MAG: nuclear transport factor 2 family protein [Siphonobacter sp.]